MQVEMLKEEKRNKLEIISKNVKKSTLNSIKRK